MWGCFFQMEIKNAYVLMKWYIYEINWYIPTRIHSACTDYWYRFFKWTTHNQLPSVELKFMSSSNSEFTSWMNEIILWGNTPQKMKYAVHNKEVLRKMI